MRPPLIEAEFAAGGAGPAARPIDEKSKQKAQAAEEMLADPEQSQPGNAQDCAEHDHHDCLVGGRKPFEELGRRSIHLDQASGDEPVPETRNKESNESEEHK